MAVREIDFYSSKPRTAILILTYRCDSRCKTCVMWKRDSDAEISMEIGLSHWKTIVDELVDNVGIRVFELFGGNVLLRKDVFIPLAEHLYNKGAAIHMPTNQLGLDEEIAEAMVRYLDTVYLSTDGVGRQNDEIRGIDGASSVGEDAVDRLLRLRRDAERPRGRLRIVCNCTVSRFNADRLEEIAAYAARKCFDEVHFEYAGEFDSKDIENSRIGDVIPEPHYVRKGESVLADRDQARNIKRSLKSIKRKHRNDPMNVATLNIDSISVKNMYEGTIPHDKCYIERSEISIDPYGNVVACPFITNYKMGNILESRFNDIWNGHLHRVFRESQNSGRMPMCRSCILGVQWNHGLLKSIQRIYLSRLMPQIDRIWT